MSQNAVRRAASLAETGLEEVQRSVAYLRETLGDNPGDLHRMLDVLCRSMDSDGIKCRFSASGSSPALSAKAARELHRLCQEALSNDCKHSGADEVRVHAESFGGSYCLTVSDEGAGFDVNDAGFNHGMGLKKYLIVNDDVDISNLKEVVWAFATRNYPGERGEVVFHDETTNPLVSFLHDSEKMSMATTKVIYNCLPPEEWHGELPKRSSFQGAFSPELQAKVLANWTAYGYKPIEDPSEETR